MSNNNLTQAGYEATIASPNPNPVKKRRNLPGNPDPDAEVIALSPKSLMATNRFMCEVCNKGFQRQQNLQLHRRVHNLPWKLNKRLVVKRNGIDNNEEEMEMVVVKKKVYVCPEEGCVHHQASRALGDLTGIKKHFSRKHGEKRFKCDKCSKKYAVHSDWKAHSKTCGSREYKCDCGTIFSRRDSFVTHRAFCDALAEESSRTINNPNPNINPPLLFTPQPSPPLNSNTFPLINNGIHHLSAKTSDQNNFNMRLLQTQPLHNIMLPLPFSLPSSSLLPSSSSSHLSATALLQKAAEMGATMSSSSSSSRQSISTLMATHHTSTTSYSPPSLLQEMMMMMMMMPTATTSAALSAATPGLAFDGFGGMMGSNNISISDDKNDEDNISNNNYNSVEVLQSEGLTRDFLGLKALPHADIFSMANSLHNDKMN